MCRVKYRLWVSTVLRWEATEGTEGFGLGKLFYLLINIKNVLDNRMGLRSIAIDPTNLALTVEIHGSSP